MSVTEQGAGTPQAGMAMLGVSAVISAPAASTAHPLALDFDLSSSALPRGDDGWDLTAFRDGSLVAACTPPATTEASPDPCVVERVVSDGDVRLKVLTSHASTWTFGTPTVARVFGPDRETTAVAASQSSFPAGTAGAVVLARDDTYPDALVGGPLAAAHHGPLLLTSPTSLDATPRAELTRVLPPGGTVYLLGGTSALTDGVAAAVAGLGYRVVRLAGADRYATAAAVAATLGTPRAVLLTTGTNFPDALAAADAAVSLGGVVLLTDGPAMAAPTAAFLSAHPGITTYAVGGPAAAAEPTATPLVGADRYATAALVASTLFPGADQVAVATGADFPDALAAGAIAGVVGAPLLLTAPSGLIPAAAAYLRNHTVHRVDIFGGPAAVPASVADAIGSTLG